MNTEINVSGKNVFATPTGLKLGSKGKVTEPGLILGQLPKGTARRLRKTLRSNGFTRHAGAARIAA